MGYKPQINEEPKNLYGYKGDKREQKAHIIIPRKQVGHLSNDVGFEKVKKGYVLHASEYDKQWRKGDKIKTLNITYSENKLRKEVNRNSKYNIFSRKVKEDGRIEIHLRVAR